MRIKSQHAQADMREKELTLLDCIYLFNNILLAKLKNCRSLTVHLPLELQHPQEYRRVAQGWMFIEYGEFLKKLFGIKLYWENAPLLNPSSKGLIHGQTKWHLIPGKIELCLDVGHLMLGAKSPNDARERIAEVMRSRGMQIKHVHIHENDLKSDLHYCPRKIITPDMLELLTHKKTYVYEN